MNYLYEYTSTVTKREKSQWKLLLCLWFFLAAFVALSANVFGYLLCAVFLYMAFAQIRSLRKHSGKSPRIFLRISEESLEMKSLASELVLAIKDIKEMNIVVGGDDERFSVLDKDGSIHVISRVCYDDLRKLYQAISPLSEKIGISYDDSMIRGKV